MVTDSSGAFIPGAKVLAVASEGASFATETNGSGIFQFPALSATEYTIHVNIPGFGPVEQKLTLLVGQMLQVDVKLTPSATSSVVLVEADPSKLDTASSQVAGNVDTSAMSKLPLNGRNWMDLSMLVPGVRLNAVTNSTPLGVANTGKFQLSLDGQQVTQNTADASFGQPQFSRDAISQFQVITNRFDATLGRSSQIYVNAQSKSGTETMHGSAFGYFRNDKFNAADPVAQRVLPFSDQQYGATLGGPIKARRLWYFGAYEGEHQPNTIVSTPLGFGNVVYTHPNVLSVNEYLLRVDTVLNDSNHLFVRGSGYTWDNPYLLASGTADPSRLYASSRTSYGYQADWNWVHGPGLVNDLKAGFTHFQWTNTSHVQSMQLAFPTTIIGGPYNYPQIFTQNTQQYRDDLYILHGKHSFKFGGEYLYEHHTGYFQQNVRGSASCSKDPASFPAVFPNTSDPSTWDLAAISPLCTSYVQGFGNFNIDIPRNTIGFWAQDDWNVRSRLTLNLGVRYDNDLGVFLPSLKLPNGLQTPQSGQNLQFAPRFGFAWDPWGRGKTVIRGGAGMYFADISANQVIDEQIFNGVTTVQAAVAKTATTNINLTDPFNGRTAEQMLANPTGVRQSVQIMGSDVRTPWSLQMSIGVQREVSRTWNLTSDFVHTRVYHDWIRIDGNLYYDPVNGYNRNPVTAGRPNPQFTNILTFLTPNAAGSIYDGLQVGVQKRPSHGITVSGAYTLSRLKDSTSSPFYYPNNPFNIGAEWAHSQDDQRHTLTVNGDYSWRWGLQASVLWHFGSGTAFPTLVGGSSPTGLGGYANNRTFSGMPVRYQSSYGRTPCAAAAGAPGCVYVYNDPSHNNLDSGSGFYITDRNAFYGRAIQRVDAKLSKTVSFHERYRAVLIFEAFNVFNHSNYGAYNTIVTSPAYGTPASAAGSPLAYAARMLQFAGRFEF
jgi:hypothetical protein